MQLFFTRPVLRLPRAALAAAVALALLPAASVPAAARPAAPADAVAAPIPASVINFRDLGGLPLAEARQVVKGLVFRSANFDHCPLDDLHSLVRAEGLGTYVDLRAPSEAERDDGPLLATGLEVLHLPFDSAGDPFFKIKAPNAAQWSEFYLRSFARHGLKIGTLFDRLANSSQPLVYGCSLGKDRTGIVTALLLAALGASDDTIAADYAATTAALSPHIDAFAHHWQQPGRSRTGFATYYMVADPQIIRAFLKELRARYGTIAHALQEVCHVSGAQLARLNARLTEAS